MIRRLVAATPQQRRAAALAVFAAPLVRRSLRRSGFAGTTDALSRRARTVVDQGSVRRVGASTDSVLRRLPMKLTCLERSIVVWWILGGSQVATIQFGVRASNAGVPDFHAWVEADGVVVNDRANVTTEFLSFPDVTPNEVESKHFSA